MARDFKLSNFTFTSVTAAANLLAVTPTSPTGDVANSGATLGLANGAAGTSTGSASDTKNVMGFLQSKQDNSSFANFITGQEVTAVTNQPAMIGNTSYAEMYMSFNMSWNLNATAANNLLENGGYFVVEGAYDNGFGSVDSSSYAPISGPVPLVVPSGNLAAVAVASNVMTTVSAHSLKVGDVVVFYVVSGFSTAPTAKQQYQVLTTPSPTQFSIAPTGSTTAVTLAGTPTAGIAVYRCIGAALGGHRAACPIVPSRRPYMRLALKYVTTATTAPATISVSRVGLTLGRDNGNNY
jgi:hypothetical protein